MWVKTQSEKLPYNSPRINGWEQKGCSISVATVHTFMWGYVDFQRKQQLKNFLMDLVYKYA